MKGSVALRVPAATLNYSLSGGAITDAAWVELLASLPLGCSAIEIYNPSPATLRISRGAGGAEAAGEIPYTVIPSGRSVLIPVEIAKSSRISARGVTGSVSSGTTGILTINFFQ